MAHVCYRHALQWRQVLCEVRVRRSVHSVRTHLICLPLIRHLPVPLPYGVTLRHSSLPISEKKSSAWLDALNTRAPARYANPGACEPFSLLMCPSFYHIVWRDAMIFLWRDVARLRKVPGFGDESATACRETDMSDSSSSWPLTDTHLKSSKRIGTAPSAVVAVRACRGRACKSSSSYSRMSRQLEYCIQHSSRKNLLPSISNA